mmetsp:Transcript_4250/g.7353  ORF Transcript_4250/g.7353 Transcript_4250/m.7353 type:complete len:263 (+) Transcript_4250:588-1376(+)
MSFLALSGSPTDCPVKSCQPTWVSARGKGLPLSSWSLGRGPYRGTRNTRQFTGWSMPVARASRPLSCPSVSLVRAKNSKGVLTVKEAFCQRHTHTTTPGPEVEVRLLLTAASTSTPLSPSTPRLSPSSPPPPVFSCSISTKSSGSSRISHASSLPSYTCRPACFTVRRAGEEGAESGSDDDEEDGDSDEGGPVSRKIFFPRNPSFSRTRTRAMSSCSLSKPLDTHCRNTLSRTSRTKVASDTSTLIGESSKSPWQGLSTTTW